MQRERQRGKTTRKDNKKRQQEKTTNGTTRRGSQTRQQCSQARQRVRQINKKHSLRGKTARKQSQLTGLRQKAARRSRTRQRDKTARRRDKMARKHDGTMQQDEAVRQWDLDSRRPAEGCRQQSVAAVSTSRSKATIKDSKTRQD